MNLSELTSSDFLSRIKGDGIVLQTGAFITRLQTSIPAVIDGIRLLYSDYALVEDKSYADFHVSLQYPSNARRWFKPQALFLFDGFAPFAPMPLDHAFPVFEWGLNWCVSSHAHRYLIIHAAVMEKDGRAVVMPAPPGSGKSTLCAALVSRGWRLLSDELTLISTSDGRIFPMPRPISLKNQSIEIMQNFAPEATFSRKVADTIKGTVAHMKAPAESVLRSSEAVRCAWIVFPKYEAGSAPRLESVPQSRAFMRVADNAFNYSMLGVHGFRALAGVIDSSLCYDFTYSNLEDAIDIFSTLKPRDAAL
ncbi:MAG: HprK-related kinase A [Pseudomonadota bacterium]